MENFHYSLFPCHDHSGGLVIFDLSQICHISIDKGHGIDYFRVNTAGGGKVVLSPDDGDRLLAAWDLYKASYHASFLVEADKEPVAAIKGAFRQDSFLYFEAVDRQRYEEETV